MADTCPRCSGPVDDPVLHYCREASEARAGDTVDRDSRRYAAFVRTVVEKIDVYENDLTPDEKVGQAQRMTDSMFAIGTWDEDRLTSDEATYLAAVIVVLNNDAKGLGAPVVRHG